MAELKEPQKEPQKEMPNEVQARLEKLEKELEEARQSLNTLNSLMAKFEPFIAKFAPLATKFLIKSEDEVKPEVKPEGETKPEAPEKGITKFQIGDKIIEITPEQMSKITQFIGALGQQTGLGGLQQTGVQSQGIASALPLIQLLQMLGIGGGDKLTTMLVNQSVKSTLGNLAFGQIWQRHMLRKMGKEFVEEYDSMMKGMETETK